MRRLFWILLVLPALAATTSSATENPFNVDFFCGWGGCYRPMEWTPVEVEVGSTLTEPFQGILSVSARQDGLNTLNMIRPFVLTPNIRSHLPIVTKFAFSGDKCEVRITNERGKPQWFESYDLMNFSTVSRLLTAVHENELLIGLIGQRKAGLLRLGQKTICRSNRGTGNVYLKDKLPRMAPWDWTGFVSLDLLILYDPDWTQLSPQQLGAIVEWISNGGRMLLVLGGHPLPADSPIGRAIPFSPQQIRQVTIPGDSLRRWNLDDREACTVPCWPLDFKANALTFSTETVDSNECLMATGCVGFGRVGVIAFDPAAALAGRDSEPARFWAQRISTVLAYETGSEAASEPSRQSDVRPANRNIQFDDDPEKTISNSPDQRSYQYGTAQAASNSIMEYLYRGIKPLSIWWVILLLGTLAVLLGPVDYKILKHRDRLPLTWLTCAFWITVFTIGAYYGVQALRAGDMELKVVSVLDSVDGTRHAWSTSYSGLFAPHSANYHFDKLRPNQWWSGIAPSQQNEWLYNREPGTRNIYCLQQDGSCLPQSVPINIWTIQCLLTESPVERMPFGVRLSREGDNITVDIKNDSDAEILNGYVVFEGERGVYLGPVGTGGQKVFEAPLRTIKGWAGKEPISDPSYYYRPGRRAPDFENENAFYAQGCLQRTMAMRDYLARGAAVACIVYGQSPAPFTVKARSCKYEHRQMARIVVFPEQLNKEIEHD